MPGRGRVCRQKDRDLDGNKKGESRCLTTRLKKGWGGRGGIPTKNFGREKSTLCQRDTASNQDTDFLRALGSCGSKLSKAEKENTAGMPKIWWGRGKPGQGETPSMKMKIDDLNGCRIRDER